MKIMINLIRKIFTKLRSIIRLMAIAENFHRWISFDLCTNSILIGLVELFSV